LWIRRSLARPLGALEAEKAGREIDQR